MADVKKPKRTGRTHELASGRSHATAKPSTCGNHVARNTRTGRFTNGVKIVSERDRDGLIKLADR